MTLAIQYETVGDAGMRLNNTVVLYDGVPHYVDTVDHPPEGDRKEIFRVCCRPLPLKLEDPAQGRIRKYISSKKFDLAPFPMGFINTDRGAVYASRAPTRQQSQGLCSKNLLTELVPSPEIGPGQIKPKQALDFNTLIHSQRAADAFAGKYPSFKEAAAETAKGLKSVAFNREFAIACDPELPFLLYLYHKLVKVGVADADTATVRLGPKRKCLTEMLTELGVRIR